MGLIPQNKLKSLSMKSKTEQSALSVTIRQCNDFLSVSKEFNNVGNFDFRCRIAGIAIEARRRVQIFHEAQMPSPGILAFQKELSLHKENCTFEKEGVKQIDTEAYMDLYEKSRVKYAKDIAEENVLGKEANQALDKKVNFDAEGIHLSELRVLDTEFKLTPTILSNILPFCLMEE
jgi:hypothetical protein